MVNSNIAKFVKTKKLVKPLNTSKDLLKKNTKETNISKQTQEYPLDSKFFTQYSEYASQYQYSFNEIELIKLKSLSTQLLNYKKKDIIKDLFLDFKSTIDNLSKLLEISPSNLFLKITSTLLENKQKVKKNTIEIPELLTFKYLKENKSKKAINLLLSYLKNISVQE